MNFSLAIFGYRSRIYSILTGDIWKKIKKSWNPVRVNRSALHLTNISDNTGTGQSEKIGTNIRRIFNNRSIQKRNNQRVGNVNAYQLTTANPRRIAGFTIYGDFNFSHAIFGYRSRIYSILTGDIWNKITKIGIQYGYIHQFYT